jgi:hypothetical protein
VFYNFIASSPSITGKRMAALSLFAGDRYFLSIYYMHFLLFVFEYALMLFPVFECMRAGE